MKRRILAIAIGLLGTLTVSWAQVPLDGTFTASQTCPALASIKKNSNPGNVAVQPGASYALRGKNNDQASHYWIEFPGAKPNRRWVSIKCGSPEGAQAAGKSKPVPAKQNAGREDFFILALSWQPAFCEARPDKKECKSQAVGDYETKNFALHGLWPQPRSNVFCDVSKADIAADEAREWLQLPEPDISAETRVALDRIMPGTQSQLERHEWIKHGTCYGNDAETYYRDSVRLTEAVNQSAVGTFVAARVGKQMNSADLRAVFDEAFGEGAGQRVRVACDRDGDRLLVTEITIGLRGNISSGLALADLMMASTPTGVGCPAGIIDPVGPQ